MKEATVEMLKRTIELIEEMNKMCKEEMETLIEENIQMKNEIKELQIKMKFF